MKKILFKGGFTLMESLVVIAIIGILTTIVMANFTTAKSKARDGKRISDIAQLQLALAQIFDRCNQYPESTTGGNTLLLTSSANGGCRSMSDFISVIPKDPFSNSYVYVTNNGNTDYVLRAKLENYNSALLDDTDNTHIPLGITVTDGCDEGASNSSGPFYYCVQPK